MSTDRAALEAKLRAEHGDATRLEACGVVAYVRVPSSDEWDRFQDELSDSKDKRKTIRAGGKLFRATCVHPPTEELGELLRKRPGLALTFGNGCAEAAGVSENCSVEKL